MALVDLQSLLDAELERLGVDPSRTSSVAPSAGNAVFDLQASVTTVVPGEQADVTLRWTERLVGDYDQNGLVNASDLVPLAQNFGSTVDYRSPVETDGIEGWPIGLAYDPVDSPNWRLARIDGNGDGVINAADVTPIAQHWQQSLSGYRVYRAFGEDGEPLLLPNPDDESSGMSIPRSAAQSTDNSQPFSYSFSDTITDAGEYLYYVAAYDQDSGSEGPPSKPVRPVLNIPPVAVLSADTTLGEAPLDVTFDASDSSDPDGTIVSYEFDLDGDGIYEIEGKDAVVSRSYTGGSHTASLRVTDDGGASADASVEIIVSDLVIPVITASATEDSIPVEIILSADDSLLEIPLAGCNWYLPGSGVPTQSSPGLMDFRPDFMQAGIKTVQLGLVGSDGIERRASIELTIHQEAVAVISPGTYNMLESDSLELRSESTGQGLVLNWSITEADGNTFVPIAGDVSTLLLQDLVAGTFGILLDVTDEFGKASSQTAVVNVFVEPELLVSFEPGQLLQDESGQLRVLCLQQGRHPVNGFSVDLLGLADINEQEQLGGVWGDNIPVAWDSVGEKEVAVRFSHVLSGHDEDKYLYELTVDVSRFEARFTAEDWDLPSGSTFEFDAGASRSDIPIASYLWDFDSDGEIDSSGPSPLASHNFPAGGYITTMYLVAESGAVRTASHPVNCYTEEVVIIRNDAGIYSANLDAITQDLDDIGRNWTMVSYSPGIAATLADGAELNHIWYRGGPGSNAEPAVHSQAWSDDEINDYMQLMQRGKSVLLMSQSHGMVSGLAEQDNGWPDALGVDLLPQSMQQSQSRHPEAAGYPADIFYGPVAGGGMLPSAPQNMAWQGPLELLLDQGGQNAAEMYSGPLGSGDSLMEFSVAEGYQLCGLASFAIDEGMAGHGSVAGGAAVNIPGVSQLAMFSYGNQRAPHEFVRVGNSIGNIYGPGRLWVVGYPWSQVNIVDSSSGSMQRSDMLHNILGWLEADQL